MISNGTGAIFRPFSVGQVAFTPKFQVKPGPGRYNLYQVVVSHFFLFEDDRGVIEHNFLVLPKVLPNNFCETSRSSSTVVNDLLIYVNIGVLSPT